MSAWTGRVDAADGPNALRWHQVVRPFTPDVPRGGVVLIGFACDEGVRRNQGRVGARDGPRAIRQPLANLAWHQESPVYDAGDVRCDDGDMEAAQDRLAARVAELIAAGHRPLVLGGGHETAWGTFQGIVRAKPDAKLGVVNIDAHLDLRADEPGNSGTSFNQIADWCRENGRPFQYLCIGAAQPSNTAALYDRLAELGGLYVPDTDFFPADRREVRGYIGEPRVESVRESLTRFFAERQQTEAQRAELSAWAWQPDPERERRGGKRTGWESDPVAHAPGSPGYFFASGAGRISTSSTRPNAFASAAVK